MTKFQLSSNYKPTGDQPAAIRQLTDGVAGGIKEQTLLGVTGSGKSVAYDSPVIVRDESGLIQRTQIGKLVDGFLDSGQVTPSHHGDTTYAPSQAYQVMSLDTQSGKQCWKYVSELSRHMVTEKFELTTTCGRNVTCSADHNLYVLRNGKLKLQKTSEVSLGDYLPVPINLPPPLSQLEKVDISGYMDISQRLYMRFSQQVALKYREVLRTSMSYRSWYGVMVLGEALRWQSGIACEGLTMESGVTIGTKKNKQLLPVQFPITKETLEFVGLYIAEGHATKGYVTISTDVDVGLDRISSFTEGLGLQWSKRQKEYDYQINGIVLSRLMKEWCGDKSENKHLPDFWPQLSDEQLANLLQGYYDGDGWVEPNAICASTASKDLASDLQYALLRFGIHARVRTKKTSGQLAYIVTTYGPARKKFMESIGFGLEYKQERLLTSLSTKKVSNTNVDIIPIGGQWIRSTREKLGMSQLDVANVVNVSRTLVSLYESGQRQPSRTVCTRILDVYEKNSTQNSLLQLEILEKRTYLGVYWSPVATISVRSAQENMYDFSVPGPETFLAGFGGIFVHNTFTMANLIQNTQKPTLVLSHNKTLAAQLYNEFKNFFPDNAVHYFVSYFDYYQPEAYIARSDTFIEKDSQINEEIDRLRHAATDALLTRRDVIIVASVSCIYGIGSPSDYGAMSVDVSVGERRVRDKFLRQLTDIQYQRNDVDFHRGTFRVRGDVVDVFPASEEVAYRIEFFGEEIDRITRINPLTGEIEANMDQLRIFPSSHYVTPQEKLKGALGKIETELDQRLAQFKKEGKLVEAQRLGQRTRFDLEMMEQTGFVKGIENYSRYLTDREAGEQPATLLDYYPDDYLLLVDESHMTMPQIRGMYNGDRARKEVLVEHGFRLPSALDNRPLTFTEFEKHINQAVYVSATPAEYELSRSPEPAQQVIRPTGLLDPPIEIKPIEGQIDDLIAEIRDTVAKRQRVLVTTLTKRMAEDLTEYLQEINIKVTYLHSDIDTLDRTDILRDLRLGTYDVVVGINLLREGLDLPEVSLVAILDADKEGFLRSEQALIQTVGRAARHETGRVIMYADKVTRSMQATLDETTRRRKIQEAYNAKHNVTPTGISKSVDKGMRPDLPEEAKTAKLNLNKIPKDEYKHLIKDLSAQMDLAAANLEFEKAAELRDIIGDIKAKL